MAGDDLYRMAAEIRILTMTVTKLAGRDLDQRLAEQGLVLSALQYGAMRVIQQHGQCTISDLSRDMMLAPPTLVPVIDALERHGMAERRRDAQDRRRALVSLTPQGVNVLAGMPHLHREGAIAGAVRQLGPEKARQLLGLLHELIAHMTDDPAVLERIEALLKSHRALCVFPDQAGHSPPPSDT